MTAEDEELRSGWLKSPYSTNGGNCVEVGITDHGGMGAKSGAGDLFVIRDSGDPDGPRLYFTRGEWEAFARGVKDGAIDGLA